MFSCVRAFKPCHQLVIVYCKVLVTFSFYSDLIWLCIVNFCSTRAIETGDLLETGPLALPFLFSHCFFFFFSLSSRVLSIVADC